MINFQLLQINKVKSNVDDASRGWPEGFLFNSYYTVVGEGATPFPELLHFALDAYLIMLSFFKVIGMIWPGIEHSTH